MRCVSDIATNYSIPLSRLNREILNLLRDASLHSSSTLADRLASAQTWRLVSIGAAKEDPELAPMVMEATSVSLDLLDLTLAQAGTVQKQYSRLTDDNMQDLLQFATPTLASFAIEFGDLPSAVTTLEQGRANILSNLNRYSAALDEVKAVAPNLADEYARLSLEMKKALLRRDSIADGSTQVSAAVRYEQLQVEWDDLVAKIRTVEGLESFLRRPSFSNLKQAAEDGPVVMINVEEDRTDAIILLKDKDPVLVPLEDADFDLVKSLADGLGPRPAELHDNDLVNILRVIWDVIVEPIVEALLPLLKADTKRKPRIWWCPSGAASRLPLHAAGPYKKGARNMNHLFVQSYTPTLATLLRARQKRSAQLRTTKPNILLIGQPDTPNERPLPKVVDEIHAAASQAPGASILMSSAATRKAVLDTLGEHAWLHLASHGHHDASHPFRSSFSMYDGPITLLNIIEKDLPKAELAVLSACHSARVSEVLPDEVLNPASGMLFAGYRSVIGTMWALDDGIGSALTEEFYKQMLGGTSGPKHYSQAAGCLDKAFVALERKRHPMSLAQRINVIHFGV